VKPPGASRARHASENRARRDVHLEALDVQELLARRAELREQLDEVQAELKARADRLEAERKAVLEAIAAEAA
jgi:hypothetical protein